MDEENVSGLTIVFDKSWLDDQRKKGFRVVRSIEKWVVAEKLATLKKSTDHTLQIVVPAAQRDKLTQALAQKLKDDFGEQNPWSHVSFSGDLAGLEVPATESSASVEQSPSPDTPASPPVEPNPSPVSHEAKSVSEGVEKPDPKAVLEKLCALSPMCYSPGLAHHLQEVARVVPALQRMAAMSSFWHQHLLVSVDDGYGLSAFVKGLGDLYVALDLVKSGDRITREYTVAKGDSERDLYECWEKAVSYAEDYSAKNARNGIRQAVLCLDVSAWRDQLGTSTVKGFLRQLNKCAENFTLVFRTPFVESHAQNAIFEALNDILNVRAIAVPPIAMDQLTDYARKSLDNRAITLTDESVPAFEQWILKEKGDDSFFGYKTLDKMVERLVYEKALKNSDTGIDDRIIRPADLNDFIGTRPAGETDPYDDLAALIGLESVKSQIREIVCQIRTQKEIAAQGGKLKRPTIHMAFSGNPGTGKTTVARLVARILRQEGILRKGHLFEIKSRDLCGRYIGETAPKTSAYCRDAYGSVLFIDEAYSLYRSDDDSKDYGREALDTLVAEMENHRDDFCVILAGYREDMKTMLQGNAGLESRIPFIVDFPNYSREELASIFFAMMKRTFKYEDGVSSRLRKYLDAIPDSVMEARTFSNARLMRNLFERTWGKAAVRRSGTGGELEILESDLALAIEAREFRDLVKEDNKRKCIGFGA